MKMRTHITITDRSSGSTASAYFLPVRKATTASHKCPHVPLLCWRAKYFLSSPGLFTLINQNKLCFIKFSCYQWFHLSDLGGFPSTCKQPRKWSLLSPARLTPNPSHSLLLSCLLSMTHQNHMFSICRSQLWSLFTLFCLHSDWLSQSVLCWQNDQNKHCTNVGLFTVSYFGLLMGMQPILSNWTSSGL